jgi:hypothetical protein
MKLQRLVLCVLCLAQLLSAGYSPTKTEINLGPISFDNYFSVNSGQIPSCPSTYTIQQCIAYFFNNNPSISPYSANNLSRLPRPIR